MLSKMLELLAEMLDDRAAIVGGEIISITLTRSNALRKIAYEIKDGQGW